MIRPMLGHFELFRMSGWEQIARCHGRQCQRRHWGLFQLGWWLPGFPYSIICRWPFWWLQFRCCRICDMHFDMMEGDCWILYMGRFGAGLPSQLIWIESWGYWLDDSWIESPCRGKAFLEEVWWWHFYWGQWKLPKRDVDEVGERFWEEWRMLFYEFCRKRIWMTTGRLGVGD